LLVAAALLERFLAIANVMRNPLGVIILTWASPPNLQLLELMANIEVDPRTP
jgi:hypothetical protein